MKGSPLRILIMALALTLPMGVFAQGGQMNAPFAGASKMTTEEAVKQAPKMSKALAPLEKAMNDAQAKWKKTPKDAKLKKAYVEATYKYARAAKLDADLPPPVKYRAALALYRKALAVDPKHKASLEEKKEIEDIYKQMGRPIPK